MNVRELIMYLQFQDQNANVELDVMQVDGDVCKHYIGRNVFSFDQLRTPGTLRITASDTVIETIKR